MLTRRTVIWAIKETVYGTDPAMAAANGILAYDVDFDVKGEKLERPVLRDTLSPIAHVIGMKECALTFKTELKGGGATGTLPNIPEIAPLYTGCGFDTGLYTGTALQYSLVSSETELNSVSFRVFIDGNVHKILGSRGSVKFNLSAGKYGEAEWSFMGLFDPVATSTLPDLASLGDTKPPIVYNASFQIGGFSPITSAAEIDLANNVIRRDSLNATYGVNGFRVTDRKPTMSFDADAVVESSNPFWGDWEGSVVDTFGILVGSNVGNKIQMNGFFEYDSNKYGDQDGVRKFDCTASLVSSSVNTQDDEFEIIYT